jgi:hypothetical protein
VPIALLSLAPTEIRERFVKWLRSANIEIERAIHMRRALSLIMCDIDLFRAVNDSRSAASAEHRCAHSSTLPTRRSMRESAPAAIA